LTDILTTFIVNAMHVYHKELNDYHLLQLLKTAATVSGRKSLITQESEDQKQSNRSHAARKALPISQSFHVASPFILCVLNQFV